MASLPWQGRVARKCGHALYYPILPFAFADIVAAIDYPVSTCVGLGFAHPSGGVVDSAFNGRPFSQVIGDFIAKVDL